MKNIREFIYCTIGIVLVILAPFFIHDNYLWYKRGQLIDSLLDARDNGLISPLYTDVKIDSVCKEYDDGQIVFKDKSLVEILANRHCDRIIPDSTVTFTFHGELGNPVFRGVTLVRIPDRMNWDHNEYLTKNGFSSNKDEAIFVREEDTCILKYYYFKGTKKVKILIQ